MNIELTPPQWEFFNLECRYPLFVAGFGAGKTQTLVARALTDKFLEPESVVGLYAPTYDLADVGFVPRIIEVLETMPVEFDHNGQKKRISIEGYNPFIYRTLDKPDRIVTYEVWRSHVDEIDTLKPDKAAHAWEKISGRNRQAVRSNAPGRISAYTTPEGFGFVYKRWVKNGGGEYQYVQAATYSNPHLPEEYIRSLRESYSPALLDAYLEGKFVNLTAGTVYASFDRDRNRSKETILKGEPLHVGMDFNVTKQCAVVHVLRKGEPHAVAELVDMYDTPSTIGTLKEQFPGHNITVYPDASGGARKTVNASLSDIALLRQAGFQVRAKSTNPSVKDRINATNVMFDKGTYRVNLDACPQYTEALEQLAYDRNGQPDKTSGVDHITDAGTYYIAYRFPVLRRTPARAVGFVS